MFLTPGFLGTPVVCWLELDRTRLCGLIEGNALLFMLRDCFADASALVGVLSRLFNRRLIPPSHSPAVREPPTEQTILSVAA